MFVNLTSLEEEAQAEFCVIGSGPAGMTVARKLAAAGRKVFLFEGGGEEISEESQDVYKGKVVAGDYSSLDACRLRYLGGTSNHWGVSVIPCLMKHFWEASRMENGLLERKILMSTRRKDKRFSILK